MSNSELLSDPNAPKKAETTAYNRESGKIKALQHLIIEIRDINSKMMNSGYGGLASRYWHLQGFAEGVVENMLSNDTPPGEYCTWLDYVQDRLEFFESAFK